MIPWSSILSSSGVNFAWLTFKFTFLQIIHLMIPSKLVVLLLILPGLLTLFCLASNVATFSSKSSNSPLHWCSYRSFRNETLSYIRSFPPSVLFSNFVSLLVFCVRNLPLFLLFFILVMLFLLTLLRPTFLMIFSLEALILPI